MEQILQIDVLKWVIEFDFDSADSVAGLFLGRIQCVLCNMQRVPWFNGEKKKAEWKIVFRPDLNALATDSEFVVGYYTTFKDNKSYSI